MSCPEAQAETEEASGGFSPIVKAFGECLLPAKQSGQFQPHFPRETLVKGQVGIWALLCWNAVLDVRRAFLTLFHSPAPQLIHFFMMQSQPRELVWVPCVVVFNAMQTYVMLLGVQLLPAKPDLWGGALGQPQSEKW